MRLDFARFKTRGLYQSTFDTLTSRSVHSHRSSPLPPSALHRYGSIRRRSLRGQHGYIHCRELHGSSVSAISPNTQPHARMRSQKQDDQYDNLPLPDTTQKPKDVDYWLYQLDKYLPNHLRWSQVDVHYPEVRDINSAFRLIADARTSAGIDLFTYMVIRQGRHDAVLHLIDMSLQVTATHVARKAIDRVPSNIFWDANSLDKLCQNPITANQFAAPGGRPINSWAEDYRDRRFSRRLSPADTRRMGLTWLSVGNMIIEAANLTSRNSKVIMSVIHRILAQLHNQNLVPDNLYRHFITPYSSTIQRPPILPFMSSRLLTTMSDAVWRFQQDENIELAIEEGSSYKDLSKNPPGGRFRLRVRDLEPEVWLELVLWCCVDGGYVSAACNIIRSLKSQAGDPWFAVHWTGSAKSEMVAQAIDWNRIKNRPRGTSICLIEGYSGTEPLVKIPNRTVSAEVILAIVEGLMSRVLWEKTDTHQDIGIYLYTIEKSIRELVSFLEPHSLSDDFFDFLAVRLLQTGAISEDLQPGLLSMWARTVQNLRSLEPVETKDLAESGFDYDLILSRTELHTGIMHNCLIGYIRGNNVSQSVETFAEVQELVDRKKLETINEFLNDPSSAQEWAPTDPKPIDLDMQPSDGQLPAHKMAAVLNFATDNDLTRLVQWLVYTDDVDGPKIPSSSYAQLCMANALLRFAGTSNDVFLLQEVITAQQTLKLRPFIGFLHTLVDSCIGLRKFGEAFHPLDQLKVTKSAGCHPQNLAKLAATILHIESETESANPSRESQLASASNLMETILRGYYNPKNTEPGQDLEHRYQQQIGALLEILSEIESDFLIPIVNKFKAQYPVTEKTKIKVFAFNVLLASVVTSKGAQAGKKLWESFCRLSGTRKQLSKLPNSNLSARNRTFSRDEFKPDLYTSSQMESVTTDGRSVSESKSTQQMTDPTDLDIDLQDLRDSYDDDGIVLDTLSQGANATNAEHHSDIKPFVTPNIKTLNIIVRKAFDEARDSTPKEQGPKRSDSESSKSITAWAKPLYEALGSSKSVVEQELRQSITHGIQRPATTLAFRRMTSEHRPPENITKYASKLGYVTKTLKPAYRFTK